MSRFRFIRSLTAAALAVASAPAAPVPKEKPETPITPANAGRLRVVAETRLDAWRLAWGPGPGRLSVIGWETPVEVLDARTFKPVRRLAADRKLVHFAAAADGTTVAWCENGTRVEVRDLRADKPRVLEVGNQQPAMAFSPDGKLLVTGGSGTEAKLWDVATGRLIRSFSAGPTQGGLTAVFSPDGKLVAVGNRNAEARLYEAATGKHVHTLPRKMTHELRFSPSGRLLAAGYVDGTVGLCDVTTGKLVHHADAGLREVYTLDWSPAGDLLATAGLGGRLTLWDRELKPVRTFDVPGWVIQVRFSPDGGRLLYAGGESGRATDTRIVAWGLPP